MEELKPEFYRGFTIKTFKDESMAPLVIHGFASKNGQVLSETLARSRTKEQLVEDIKIDLDNHIYKQRKPK